MSERGVRFANIKGPGAPAGPAAAAPKPNLGTPRGEVIAGKQLFYPAWKPEGSWVTSTLGLLYSLSFWAFMIFLVLVFIHFTIYPVFSFTADDGGFIPVPTASDKQKAFTKSPAAPDVSANVISLSPCGYTIAMDVFQVGNFQATTIPRVLLYRSPTEVTVPLSDTSGNFMTRFSSSNLLVWLDPLKNDLYVSAITQSADGVSRVETTPAIQNVPMREPFRVTIIFVQQFVEVYLNGNLQVSMPFKNPPISTLPSAYFFPVVRAASTNVMLGNLFYWDRPISAGEARLTGKPVGNTTFFTATSS